MPLRRHWRRRSETQPLNGPWRGLESLGVPLAQAAPARRPVDPAQERRPPVRPARARQAGQAQEELAQPPPRVPAYRQGRRFLQA